MDKKYTFIDLFAGCGGLSEGFYMEDFEALAHVEIDPVACKTLKTRMDYYGYNNSAAAVLEADITSDDIMSKVYSQKHILPSEDVRANIKEMIVDVKEQAQDHREVVADATLVQVYVDGKVYSGRFSKPYSGRISANALDRFR